MFIGTENPVLGGGQVVPSMHHFKLGVQSWVAQSNDRARRFAVVLLKMKGSGEGLRLGGGWGYFLIYLNDIDTLSQKASRT